MKSPTAYRGLAAPCLALALALAAGGASAQEAGSSGTNAAPLEATTNAAQFWNWHVQNTDIGDYHPRVPARYSGPNSLSTSPEVQDTVSLDLLAGVRLWPGAEFHLDGLMWQGFGFSRTLGVESFPNGEAFRLGTSAPNVNFTRVFIRQTFGLGGGEENVDEDALHLAGRQDIERITVTIGKFSAKDIFDNNTYANDPRTQFLSWGLMANEAWDYPADSIGFITGMAVEWNEPQWTLRQGFFQMPRVSNGTAQDMHYLDAWGLVTELERRFAIAEHPGAARLLAYLNRADMGSYQAAVDSAVRPADITATRAYRQKYGFGLNLEQEVVTNVGVFSRLGWSDGHNEGWVFSDVDYSVSAGVSIKGAAWHRPGDTLALAGVGSGASHVHQEFLAAGGTGILAGDGALSYAWEKELETYYDIRIIESVHATLDYQYVADPAFNRARGPVNVLSARLHWEF